MNTIELIILNGIKAAHLVNEVQNGHLQTIDALNI